MGAQASWSGNDLTNVQPTLPTTMNQHQAQTYSNNYQQNQNNQTLNNSDDAVNSCKNYENFLKKHFTSNRQYESC